MKRSGLPKTSLLAGLCVLLGISVQPGNGHAQEIEPRAYTNAPVGVNFLIAGYSHSSGGVAFDPAVPLTNARIKTDSEVLAYVRVLDVAGQSAKFDVILPYVSLAGTAEYAGQAVARDVSGFGDPKLRFSMNFYGAPALGIKEFSGYKHDLIIGGSIQVSLPTGQYDRDKLLNIGTNRWYVRPEVGASKGYGPWTFEVTTGVTVFGDNDDFFGGKRRQQDPIYSLQGHLVYAFASGIWGALTAANLRGGRSTLDGFRGNDLQQNSRWGATLAYPVDRYHSIKLHAGSGIHSRTGSNFDTISLAWQYRWGGGL